MRLNRRLKYECYICDIWRPFFIEPQPKTRETNEDTQYTAPVHLLFEWHPCLKLQIEKATMDILAIIKSYTEQLIDYLQSLCKTVEG